MRTRNSGDGDEAPSLDLLLEEILTDAYGDDEQLWAFRQAFEDNVTVPLDAFVTGKPVKILAFDYDGKQRRGVTALCRDQDGELHVLAVTELLIDEDPIGAAQVAAYRKWMGLTPLLGRRRLEDSGATHEEIDLDQPLDLVTLSVKKTTARCQIPGSEHTITLRTKGVWNIVPGEIVTVRPRRQWRHACHPYLSGDIERCRLDVPALGLTPLGLASMGDWDPRDEYWGEVDEPLDDWAKPIIAMGVRPAFEMEQILPGADVDDPDSDPIVEAAELHAIGDFSGAQDILMKLLLTDLRCLDAHAHLGNHAFDHWVDKSRRHYEAGVAIGNLSLGDEFDGVLSWGHIDNRPFLRCLHGLGLCLWRLDRNDEAAALFERMLWLNPSDNQGARYLLAQVQAGEQWADDDEES